MKSIVLFVLFVSLPFNQALALDYFDVKAVYLQLGKEAKQERAIIADEYARDRIVKGFAKRLSKLDDHNLGDVQLLQKVGKQSMQDDLQAFKKELAELVDIYHHAVKPILLNNVKLKRKDKTASLNKTNLSQLFFRTKRNHKTGRPVEGFFHYQQNISDSIFSTQLVDAGILVNFPELEQDEWVQDARDMEMELVAFLRLHRAYQDGVPFLKPKAQEQVVKESAVKASTVAVVKPTAPQVGSIVPQQKPPTKPVTLSAKERSMIVQKFAWNLIKLDSNQPWEEWRSDLASLVKTYEQTVKDILVNNINLHRQDSGSRANKGSLISLFYPNKGNHKTGKPVMGKLKYEKDVSGSIFSTKMAEVGLLVERPELAQDPLIQRALKMESELEVLLKEHRKVIKRSDSLFIE